MRCKWNILLNDGVLNSFDNSYSNGVDGKDARKSSNTAENLSIMVGGKLLAIERRQMPTPHDTIFFNLTGVRVNRIALNLQPQTSMLRDCRDFWKILTCISAHHSI